MSYSLHVPLFRAVRGDELLATTEAVLAELTGLQEKIEIEWKHPPNTKVRAALTDVLSIAVSFYVTFTSVPDGSLVQFGVIDPSWRPNEPQVAYFCAHDFAPASVLALAMAIAAARLTGSTIEDGSSHWFAQESNQVEDVLRQFRLEKPPGNLSSALTKIDASMSCRKRATH